MSFCIHHLFLFFFYPNGDCQLFSCLLNSIFHRVTDLLYRIARELVIAVYLEGMVTYLFRICELNHLSHAIKNKNWLTNIRRIVFGLVWCGRLVIHQQFLDSVICKGNSIRLYHIVIKHAPNEALLIKKRLILSNLIQEQSLNAICGTRII